MDLIDLQGLTAEERNIILNVIRRDEELRHRQDNRISELKQELHNLRMNGVLRSGDNLSKMCARCKNPFGFFVNTGENCPVCKFRVCKNCKENLLTQGWMCTLCFKENQLQWLTGDWMQKEEETNHKTEEFRNGTDLVRASLRVKHSNGNKIRSVDKGQDGQDNDHKLEEKTLSGHEDEGEEEEHDPCNDSAYSTAGSSVSACERPARYKEAARKHNSRGKHIDSACGLPVGMLAAFGKDEDEKQNDQYSEAKNKEAEAKGNEAGDEVSKDKFTSLSTISPIQTEVPSGDNDTTDVAEEPGHQVTAEHQREEAPVPKKRNKKSPMSVAIQEEIQTREEETGVEPENNPESSLQENQKSASHVAFDEEIHSQENLIHDSSKDTPDTSDMEHQSKEPADKMDSSFVDGSFVDSSFVDSSYEQPEDSTTSGGNQQEVEQKTAAKLSLDNLQSLEQQAAEAEKMRSHEVDLPYTMQRYFLVDDASSDTLSIISERTEPGDPGDDTDRDEDDDLDSDSDGTIHDDLDANWSDDDDEDEVLNAGVSTPRRMSVDDTFEEAADLQLKSQLGQANSNEEESTMSEMSQPSQSSGHPNDVDVVEESRQAVQEEKKSPISPVQEVCSTQTEEVFIVSKDQEDQMQNYIRHVVQEALPKREDAVVQTDITSDDDEGQASVGSVSRSTSQEDSSTQTDEDDILSQVQKSPGQDLFQQEVEPSPGYANRAHREVFLWEHDQQASANLAESKITREEPSMKPGDAIRDVISREMKEEQHIKTATRGSSKKPLESHEQDSGAFSLEGQDSLEDQDRSLQPEQETRDTHTEEMEKDLVSKPADFTAHGEALLLDQEESDEASITGTDRSGADGESERSAPTLAEDDYAVDFNTDRQALHDVMPAEQPPQNNVVAKPKKNVMHAARVADQQEIGLVYECMTGLGKRAGQDEARRDDLPSGASSTSTAKTHAFVAHRAYVDHADYDSSSDDVSCIAPPKPKRSAILTTRQSSEEYDASISHSVHDSDSDSYRSFNLRDLDLDSTRSSSFRTENTSRFNTEEHADGELSSLDSFLPEATMDLDDVEQASVSPKSPEGYMVSSALSTNRGRGSADEEDEVVSQCSGGQLSGGGSTDDERVDPSSTTDGGTLIAMTQPGAHDAPEPQHISSNLNKSRQSDGDFTGASDQSDGGGASPMRPSSKASGGGGGTPKRSSNSHLSTPSVVATSHTGSIGEKSVDDDDNIDELFAKHLPGSRLGISRNSIGSSRESLASVYSDAGEINYGRIPVTGDITFSLVYDVKCSALRVHIKGCHDLAPVDTKHNRSDPYVKVYLLPDKTRSGKRKTKIKKHTLNPVFDETLSYHISQGELENRTLWVTVWHSDRFGRNDFLGEVTIPMDVHRFDDTAFCTYDLESRMPEEMNETAMQYKGELVVSLMYVTPDKVEDGKKSKSKSKKSKAAVDPRGEVHAMIKAANNLTAVRSNGGSDPFVKGYLLPDQRRTGKQKTPVVKNSVNPMWNQILVFDGIDPMELADRSLELTVWDHEKLGTNEFLGGVRLNLGQGVVKGGHQVDWMDARGEEAITWQSMMERPNTWIDAKLPLRASMGKSSTKK
ncbi:uncharacterized protein [Littorina saxatilis]|uniref:uncharacterized protein isoform X1 n=1 Tax=Littorina saxatilis TaxID=31220 RepID=UPI0038B5B232